MIVSGHGKEAMQEMHRDALFIDCCRVLQSNKVGFLSILSDCGFPVLISAVAGIFQNASGTSLPPTSSRRGREGPQHPAGECRCGHTVMLITSTACLGSRLLQNSPITCPVCSRAVIIQLFHSMNDGAATPWRCCCTVM